MKLWKLNHKRKMRDMYIIFLIRLKSKLCQPLYTDSALYCVIGRTTRKDDILIKLLIKTWGVKKCHIICYPMTHMASLSFKLICLNILHRCSYEATESKIGREDKGGKNSFSGEESSCILKCCLVKLPSF